MFGKKVNTDPKKIEEVLTRRIESVFPSREQVEKRLREGEKLKVYLGIDPTGPDLHLGHTIPLLFLKQLLELGHKPVLVIGDFTARIGDPTDKEATRKPLTEKEVKNNMKNYLDQAYKILPKGSFDVKYNSSWLSKMSFTDVVELASHVTVQQMLQRDMFQRRLWKWRCPNCKKVSRSPIQFGTQEAYDTATLKDNSNQCPHCNEDVSYEKEDIFLETELKPISLNEFLYPLMQGYDSVAMKIDGEVGGNDQTFNMLVGRDLEKKLLNKDKIVFTTRLLVDAKSGRKMSKTEGGLISLSDSPQDIFGKTMKTIPDEMIRTVFELCTEKSQQYIKEKEGNPYEFKKELAFELVRMYHDEKEAEKSKDEWDKVFSRGEYPSDIEEVEKEKLIEIVGGVIQGSNSSMKALFDQGAIRVNNEVKKEWNFEPGSGDVIQIGPKKFVKVKLLKAPRLRRRAFSYLGYLAVVRKFIPFIIFVFFLILGFF